MYAAGTRHVLFKDDDCYRADCSAESKRDGVVRPPFTASTASTAARSKVELVDGDGDFVAKFDGLAQGLNATENGLQIGEDLAYSCVAILHIDHHTVIKRARNNSFAKIRLKRHRTPALTPARSLTSQSTSRNRR